MKSDYVSNNYPLPIMPRKGDTLWTPAHSGVVAKRGQKVELLIPRELLVSENTLEVLLDHL